MKDKITIKGARVHNLKNIDVEIPRDKFVVITGLSGSGKSSLAFDTIYAEGQRRYVESLSAYARQFLGQMDKPDIDYIEGLSPAISIDQKTTSKNPRSTVGTVTEIYDYLRLLYARIGIVHCPSCGREIMQQTVDQITDSVLSFDEGEKILVLAPVLRGRKGEHTKIFETARKNGFTRVRVDGNMYMTDEVITLDKNKKHHIDIVVDRLVVKGDIRQRLAESIETAQNLTDGLVIINKLEKEDHLYSLNYACPECDINIEELTPRMFSFNSPFGACPSCSGLGNLIKVDPEFVLDKEKSIREGGVNATGWSNVGDESIAAMYYEGMAKHYGFSLDVKIKELPENVIDILLYGTKGAKIKMEYSRSYGSGSYFGQFEGIINNLERRHRETSSEWARAEIEMLMSVKSCPDCGGQRLKKEALAVTVGNINIYKMTCLSVDKSIEFLKKLKLSPKAKVISERILKEIIERLTFLKDVGLDYLSLSRNSGTLSGGEAQRIRLATQISSSLMGVLYILDEPSIGLHQRDNARLLSTLKKLRDLGNTLIVVEHDEETILNADYILDIGPGAGVHGGEIVAQGTPKEITKNKNSITGQYLSGRKKIETPKTRRPFDQNFLIIKGARENNLKNIDVQIPLKTLTCVTGVSGSGKSSLVNQILYKKLASALNRAKTKPGLFDAIEGIEHLDKIINIDQSPIGRTPRSNPATYTGVFSDIRDVFASTSEARMKGYKTGRFSFNVKGGRCEACSGDGIIKIEMHFLPDVYVPCEVCKGKRYNRETLEIRYKGKNIHEVLEMTVEEGLKYFENIPRIKRKLQTLFDVGLGYIKIGQPSTTLSGGEAQRVKMATELAKRDTGKTIYILDEPTTGLHMDDVHNLIGILNKLVDAGNTMVVIEHNLDVIKTADYIIDLGPEGGDKGGQLICCGTPEHVATCENSYTGQFLAKTLLNK